MYNEQIENLIRLALVDGDLTEKEKQILFKKAELAGIDLDEFEMVLDAKLVEKRNATLPPTAAPKSEKYGDIRKCPACGTILESFITNCKDCGYEFRNIEVANSVNRLFNKLREIDEHVWKTHPNRNESIMEHIVRKAVADKQAELLSSFPIPNSKEDILEFLTLAFSEANVKLSFFESIDLAKRAKRNAYRTKCEQVILKARFSMKDDKKTLEEIEHYAKQLNIK